MDIGFQFEVTYKDKDLMKVRVSAWNGTFGGTAVAYLGIGQLEEFAATLEGFPRSPSDTREITLGAFGPEWAGGGVSMQFYCADRAGHAYVESKIESDDVDKQGRTIESVVLSLPIEAAAVDSFVEELRQLSAEKAKTARLCGAEPGTDEGWHRL